jgi:hypothetical protein
VSLKCRFRASFLFSLTAWKQSDRMPLQCLLTSVLSTREHRRSWSNLVLALKYLQPHSLLS